MIVLSGNDISVSFGGETLFHDVNFRLEENGRAGLVGVNGCGKTTLMHVINGRQEAETGGISKAAGIKIGCMEQYVIRDDNITLYDEVLEIFRPLIDAENELADIAVAIDTGARRRWPCWRTRWVRRSPGPLTRRSGSSAAGNGSRTAASTPNWPSISGRSWCRT